MSEIANDVKFSTVEIVSNLGLNFSSNDTRIKHTGTGELTMSSTTGDLTFSAGGSSSNTMTINAVSGGIDINAGGRIAIDTTDTDGGIHIGTSTSGVPIVIGTSTSSATVAGDLVVSGNLTVNGDSVTNNVITYTSEDSMFYLNSGQTGTSTKDIGLIGERGSANNVGWIWDESADEWVAVHTNTTEGNDGLVNILNYNQIRCGGLAVVSDTSKDSTDFNVDIDGAITIYTSSSGADSYLIHTGSPGNDLSIQCVNGSLNLTSGESAHDAIKINANSGGIRLLTFGHNVNIAPQEASESATSDGHALHVSSYISTDSSTSSGATTAVFNAVNIQAPEVEAVNDSITTTTANTLYISGAPVAGTNQTFTNRYALNADGPTRIGGTLLVNDAVEVLSTITIHDYLDMGENNIVNVNNIYLNAIRSNSDDIVIDLEDNRSNALEIKEDNRSYMVFNTTNGSESIQLNKNITLRTGEAITLTHTADANGEDLTIAQAGAFDASLLLTSTGTGSDAIGLTANSGGIDINAGSGGIAVDTTGALSLDAGSASNFTTTAGNINIEANNGSVIINGGNAVADAIYIVASAVAGGIDIEAGNNGIYIDTTGTFSITSTSTVSESVITHFGAPGQDLSVSCPSGSLRLVGGEEAIDAVVIQASHAGGGIKIDSGTGGIDIDTTGYLYINTGSGGIDVISNGLISLNANTSSGTSNITHTGSSGSDLTVSCTSGSLNLTAGEEVANAIRIQASHANGGIDIDAGTAGIALDTTGIMYITSSDSNSSSLRITASHTSGGIDIDAGTGGVELNTTGSLELLSSKNASGAIRLYVSDDSGNISVMHVGNQGFLMDTSKIFSIDSTNTSGASNITHVGSAGQDLTVSCTSGSLNLTAGEATSDAVAITASAGGIRLTTTGSNIGITPANANESATSNGHVLHVSTNTSTDSSTATSGTATVFNAINVQAPTVAATNASVTTTTANTLYISGAPVAGTNQTLTNRYALNADGNSRVGGDLTVSGAIASGSISATGDLDMNNNDITNVDNIALNTISADSNDIAINLTDNRSNALEAKQGINSYMVFNTTNGSEAIQLNQNITLRTGNPITLTHTSDANGEDLTIAQAGAFDASLLLTSTGTGADAIGLTASAGGIMIDATGGLSLDSSSTTASSNLTHVGALGQDLTVSCTAGSLNLIGGEAVADAVRIQASAGAGGIDIDAGSGGIAIDTTGALSIDAGAASNFNTSAGDITIDAQAGSVIIDGGESATDAVRIHASAVAGGIDIDAGSGGINVLTSGTLTLNSSSSTAPSNLTHAGASGQDLTVSCTSGSLNLTAGEAVSNAVLIQASNGGITIDSGVSGITIDTSGAISIDADSASHFNTSSGNITIDAEAGRVIIDGGEAVSNAVRIHASAGAGGIDIDAGSGGIAIDTTGAISIDVGAASNFNTSAGDITIDAQAGSVIIDGGESATDAVRIHASAVAGGIDIDAGSGGINVLTSGTLTLNSSSSTAPSNLTHAGASGQDLTVSCTSGSLNLTAGEAVADAIAITASAGGITISTTSNVLINTGNLDLNNNDIANVDDIELNTISANSNDIAINLTDNRSNALEAKQGINSYMVFNTTNGSEAIQLNQNITLRTGNPITLTHTSDANGEDLTIAQAGAFDASLLLTSTGTGADAIGLTASAGGIMIDATGGLSLDSSSTTASSNLTHVGALGQDLTVSCTAGSLILSGGENVVDAVKIEAPHTDGGITMTSGSTGVDINTTGYFDVSAGGIILNTTGDITVTAGYTGITVDTSGTFSIDSSNSSGASNITHAGAPGQDLTVSCTSGSLNLTGGEADANAVAITASAGGVNINGGGAISNAVRINASNGAGGIDIDAGSGGIDIDTTGNMTITVGTHMTITGDVRTLSNNGTTGTGVTAVEHGTSRLHLTVLTLTNVDLGNVSIGADSTGALIYTLPAGAIVVKNSYMSIGLTNTDTLINADTPFVGLGTVIASTGVSDLTTPSTYQNILTGQTAANVTGTATVKTTIPQLIIESGDAHTVHLNVADTWAGADTSVKANGTIVLEWTLMN